MACFCNIATLNIFIFSYYANSQHTFFILLQPTNKAKLESFDKINAGSPHKYRLSAFQSCYRANPSNLKRAKFNGLRLLPIFDVMKLQRHFFIRNIIPFPFPPTLSQSSVKSCYSITPILQRNLTVDHAV